MVFKPGMPFEAQIAVRYHDQVSLTQEQLGNSRTSVDMDGTLKFVNYKIGGDSKPPFDFFVKLLSYAYKT